MEYIIEILLLGYRALKGNKKVYIILLFKNICILDMNGRINRSSRWKLKIKGMRTDVSCPYTIIM